MPTRKPVGGDTLKRGMAKSSLDELRAKIAAGEYAIDSGALAGRILTDFAVIRRVRRIVMGAAGSATFRPR